jgi:hypothetical protein
MNKILQNTLSYPKLQVPEVLVFFLVDPICFVSVILDVYVQLIMLRTICQCVFVDPSTAGGPREDQLPAGQLEQLC